ncbi:MAG: hypothetical protein MUO61_04545 [Dehalococcoidia bacterium]|nr:hypothetical protein [Dehalococcoidia bacterium]
MKKKILSMAILSIVLLLAMFSVVSITHNVMGHKGNQTVEITQVLSGEHMYYIVKITDPDGIDVVHPQIRNPDGVLVWDGGHYYPDGQTTFEFTIPQDVVIENGGIRVYLEVKLTDSQDRPVFSKWITPEWYTWEPPYWPTYEQLTCVYEDYAGGRGGIIQLPDIEEGGAAIPDLSGHNHGTPAGIIAGAIAGATALISAAWYIRRRRTKAI